MSFFFFYGFILSFDIFLSWMFKFDMLAVKLLDSTKLSQFSLYGFLKVNPTNANRFFMSIISSSELSDFPFLDGFFFFRCKSQFFLTSSSLTSSKYDVSVSFFRNGRNGGTWSCKVSKSISWNQGCFLISVASVSAGLLLCEPNRFFWSQHKDNMKFLALDDTSGVFGNCSVFRQLIIFNLVVALSFEQNGG